MFTTLLHIGHDTVRPIVDLIAYLNEIRSGSALLKLLLWPVVYALTFIKVMTNYLVFGAHKFYYYSMPYNILTTRNHFFSATPMSIACFNKRGFALVFVEMIIFIYMMCIPAERPWLLLPYFLFKIVLTAVPFVALTPIQRLPFWFFAVIFTAVETWAGIIAIRTWGYGINFRNHHFYNHWGKHYRYRSITSNRIIGTELSQMIYFLVKVLVLNDYFCYNADTLNARILAPRTPTWGGLYYDAPENTYPFSFTIFCSIAFFVFCCLYVNFFLKSDKNVPSIFTNTIFSFAFLADFLLFISTFCATFSPYCWLVSHIPLTSLVTLTTLLVLFVLNTRNEAPLDVAPILERPPAINTSIIAVSKIKLSLENSVNSCKVRVLLMIGTTNNSEAFGVAAQARSLRTESALADDYDFATALVEQDTVASLRYGVLFLLALSSLGVYSIILAGWSSNSKYAFIGALRSAAQMISYEVAISLIILPVVVFCGSLDLSMITYIQYITEWLCWPLLPIAILFLIAMLAETNRTPFDLPEAEAELVAGYNVDYSSLPFAMFFLGEYCNMILISTLFCILFLAGGLNATWIASSIMLSVKAAAAWIFFVLVRATLPRYRYDQLMDIGWKVFLPTSGSFLPFVFGILVVFHALPVSNELPQNPWLT